METQYSEATQSFEQDLFTAFVFNGLVSTIDGSIANQLDVTAGVAFPKQTDNTLRRRATIASTTGQFTTSTPSTTYYLDLNPDGTFSWGTSHSGVTNYLPICSATTNSGGNLLVVTDARTLTTAFLLGGGILNGLTLAAGKNFKTQNTASGGGVTGKFELSDPDLTTAYFDLASDKVRLVTNYLGGATQILWLITTATGALSLDSGKIVTDGLGTMNGNGTAAPGAPSLGLAAGTNLGIGVYQYQVTFVTSLGESALGTLASITTTTGNQQVNLTAIPTSAANAVTKRKIYRTTVGGSAYFLLTTLNDNTTTTYTDSTADGSLGAAAPAHPTLAGTIWTNSSSAVVAQVFGDGAATFAKLTSNGDLYFNGNASAAVGSGIPMTRAGVAVSVPIYTSTTTPSSPPTNSVWIKA
jgi:hypothetical protein